MPLTLVIRMKKVSYIGGQNKKFLTLVDRTKKVSYIGGQNEESFLHWWSVKRMFLTSMVSRKNAPYISGQ
ncbi:unnamed protein product [Staurois parvus]|uniref:Uncharacterized protein n=1 Tax=Staurois parvus TaxID=386267 RepID=A0ABN9CZ60_9NEOB|nr:unnamed protein product [Staurois parvus]